MKGARYEQARAEFLGDLRMEGMTPAQERWAVAEFDRTLTAAWAELADAVTELAEVLKQAGPWRNLWS